MADNGGGGTSMLAFIVGGLLVAVVVIGFLMWNGGVFGGHDKPAASLEVHVPSAPSP